MHIRRYGSCSWTRIISGLLPHSPPSMISRSFQQQNRDVHSIRLLVTAPDHRSQLWIMAASDLQHHIPDQMIRAVTSVMLWIMAATDLHGNIVFRFKHQSRKGCITVAGDHRLSSGSEVTDGSRSEIACHVLHITAMADLHITCPRLHITAGSRSEITAGGRSDIACHVLHITATENLQSHSSGNCNIGR